MLALKKEGRVLGQLELAVAKKLEHLLQHCGDDAAAEAEA